MISLTSYESHVNRLRECAKENGITEKEVNALFAKCFDQLEKERMGPLNVIFFIVKAFFVFLLLLIVCFTVLYNHPATHNLILRNLQHLIYPGLSIFRKITVPIITKYPDLTNLYDEWCVIENPYFRVSDMDCWPCSSIISVPDLTGYNVTRNFNIGIPFTKFDHKKVYFNHIRELYNDEKSIFDTEARGILSNNISFRTINHIFDNNIDSLSLDQNVHVTWRITRLKSGRLLRRLFARPLGVPDWWGQSTERFVFIDEPKAPNYPLPNPECSNIILQCTSGTRLIRLEPSPECMQNCRILTVLLTAGQSLWYNWWYWRPYSLPAANQTKITINYLTSYC